MVVGVQDRVSHTRARWQQKSPPIVGSISTRAQVTVSVYVTPVTPPAAIGRCAFQAPAAGLALPPWMRSRA